MKYLVFLALFAGCTDEVSSPDQIEGSGGKGDGSGADATPQTICGHPEPTIAPPSISVRGKTGGCCYGPDGENTIEVWRTGGIAPIASGLAEDGEYTPTFNLTVPTNGMAIDGYIRVTHVGFDDAYQYFDGPLADNWTQSYLPVETPDVEAVHHNDGKPNPTRGIVVVSPIECDGYAIFGATVFAPGAYATPPSPWSTQVVLDAPVGPLDFTTTRSPELGQPNQRALRRTHIEVRANAITYVDVLPQ